MPVAGVFSRATEAKVMRHRDSAMPINANSSRALDDLLPTILGTSARSQDVATWAKLARQGRCGCGTLVGKHANSPAINNASAIDRSMTANTAPIRSVGCFKRQTGNEHNR